MRSFATLLIHNIISICEYPLFVRLSIDTPDWQHYMFFEHFSTCAKCLWRSETRMQINFEFTKMKPDLHLSKNFLLSEFVRSATAKNNNIHQQFTIELNVLTNLIFLTNILLQPLREFIGPVNITSGYRCEKVNTIIGGTRSSQHIYGQAVDFTCANLPKAILFIKNRTFDQLIIYDSFIHVSLTTSLNRKQVIDKRSH